MNGSQTTGQASSTPNRASISRRSSSVVTGVMRSTIEQGKATCSPIQSPSAASSRAANAVNARRARWPLPSRLSQDITVNGTVPRSRRRRSASVTSS
jgi:hypothetical protein